MKIQLCTRLSTQQCSSGSGSGHGEKEREREGDKDSKKVTETSDMGCFICFGPFMLSTAAGATAATSAEGAVAGSAVKVKGDSGCSSYDGGGGDSSRISNRSREGEEAEAVAEELAMTPCCGHTAHADCLLQWLRLVQSCPLCRGALCMDVLLSVGTGTVTGTGASAGADVGVYNSSGSFWGEAEKEAAVLNLQNAKRVHLSVVELDALEELKRVLCGVWGRENGTTEASLRLQQKMAAIDRQCGVFAAGSFAGEWPNRLGRQCLDELLDVKW